MIDISEKLIVEQSGGIFRVSQISWESFPWQQLSLVTDEDVISLSHTKVYVFSDSVLCLGKKKSEPNIKILLGNDSWVGSRVHHNTELWKSFPRIHHIAALQQSP